jgi:hypothetical protein
MSPEARRFLRAAAPIPLARDNDEREPTSGGNSTRPPPLFDSGLRELVGAAASRRLRRGLVVCYRLPCGLASLARSFGLCSYGFLFFVIALKVSNLPRPREPYVFGYRPRVRKLQPDAFGARHKKSVCPCAGRTLYRDVRNLRTRSR